MIPLIFATNNANKLKEIQFIIGNQFEIISLRQAGIDIDIPEPHNTLEANASEKSKTIHQLTQSNCFSEDTGLEVYALNGEPGVKSARYAGQDKAFEKNIEKLLSNLGDNTNREARFRTVISLILNNQEFLFEGICEGRIETKIKGTSGFGYDPIFTPTGSNKTFGEMDMEEKNKYSHRNKATTALILFLHQLQNQ